MQVVQDWPPNRLAIEKKFELSDYPDAVFAYGDILYNPSGLPIPEDLMVHEQTHQIQQQAWGVQDWWIKYLKDDTFRLTQEVEAYRNQYQFVQNKINRQQRRRFLQNISKALASSMYGNIIDKKTAQELIENYE